MAFAGLHRLLQEKTRKERGGAKDHSKMRPMASHSLFAWPKRADREDSSTQRTSVHIQQAASVFLATSRATFNGTILSSQKTWLTCTRAVRHGMMSDTVHRHSRKQSGQAIIVSRSNQLKQFLGCQVMVMNLIGRSRYDGHVGKKKIMKRDGG